MADRRNAEIPNGSPHDIAMVAYRIAEQAMAHITEHERDCRTRWEEQRKSMSSFKDTALANFQAAGADRAAFSAKLDAIEERANSFLFRSAVALIGMLVTGLTGTIWYIITQK